MNTKSQLSPSTVYIGERVGHQVINFEISNGLGILRRYFSFGCYGRASGPGSYDIEDK
jgi:hypothetical protein